MLFTMVPVSNSNMIYSPDNSLHEPPEKLLNDMKQAHAVFFIGSSFLEPPRYEQLEDIMELVEREMSFGRIAHRGDQDIANVHGGLVNLGRRQYEDLRNYLDKWWPVSKYGDLRLLINNFTTIPAVITSCFDRNIRNSLKKTKKNILDITGVDSTKSGFEVDNNEDDLVLYQLLGTVDKPDTLRLTHDQMYDLRKEFRSSTFGSDFLKHLIKNNTLVLLGYESRDLYDNFFRELINDLYYWKKISQPFPQDIYFVNRLRYDTNYGLWAERDESQLNVIALSPSSFIERLNGGSSSER
jgi:hypothetical protein